MTEGRSSVLPMTNVHAWEQYHSYTEVIKGLKDIYISVEGFLVGLVLLDL